MKNLAESSVAALPQPPPDAALMSASEYQLWRLSLNASRRGPSELNTPHAQEIDEAWAFIVNGAGKYDDLSHDFVPRG